jgi:hypothetical protein
MIADHFWTVEELIEQASMRTLSNGSAALSYAPRNDYD